MRTIVVNPSWITKYWIADTLLTDANYEEFIQVLGYNETMEEFFKSLPSLNEFTGDERIQYIDLIKDKIKIDRDIGFDNVDAVILDPPTIGDTDLWVDHLGFRNNFKGRVILPSSWEVYGWKSIKDVPIKENEYPNPETEFGKMKAEQERIIKESDLDWVILRYSMVFGPYCPPNEITEMIYNTLVGQDIYIRQPASRFLDMNYVTNVVPAISKALTKPNIGHQIFNIGFGGISDQSGKRAIVGEKKITNLAKWMRIGLGHNSVKQGIIISEDNLDKVQGRGFHSQLDIEKAQKELDYGPLYDHGRGFLSTAMWIQSTLREDELGVPEITVKGKKTGKKKLEDRYGFLKKGSAETRALEKGGRLIEKHGVKEEELEQ